MNRQGENGIAWTDFTANPLRYRAPDGRVVWACEKLSAGCTHCYAESLSRRYTDRRAGDWNAAIMATLTPFLDEKELHQMLTSKQIAGKRVFVGDMTDLFGSWVPDELLDRLFAVFALRADVTWQVLTKRAERMRDYAALGYRRQRVINSGEQMRPSRPPAHWYHVSDWSCRTATWPLSNVWLLVSVEDQASADERIPHLLNTPAAVRGVSYEPALGPVDVRPWLDGKEDHGTPFDGARTVGGCVGWTPPLDWVIAGAESGPRARPCDVSWLREVVQQCRAAGVACFMKQLGAMPYIGEVEPTGRFRTNPETGRRQMEVMATRLDLRDRKGADPSEWPDDLMVREFPAGGRR